MAHLPTQPQGNPTVLASDHWFNGNVRVYGELWNDRANIGSIEVENLKVTESVILEGVESLDVDGPATFNDTATFNGPATFNNTVTIDELINDYLVVNKRLNVGSEIVLVGNDDDPLYNSYNGRIGVGNLFPQQRLDIAGSIKIDENIYDSTNNAGVSGFFLSRDASGIRWVSVAPGEGEGILVQNEGVTVGSGQSFGTLNFIGTLTGGDLVQAFPNNSNPQIADIFISSFWIKDGGGDLSTSRSVAIGTDNNQGFRLYVDGTSTFEGDGIFTENVAIAGGLNVQGIGSFFSDVFFDGGTVTILPTTSSTSPLTGAFQVRGGTGIQGNLNVGGFSEFDSNATFNRLVLIEATNQSTATTNGALIVAGGVGIAGNVNIGDDLFVAGFSEFGQQATFSSLVRIDDTTNSVSPVGGALQVDGGVGIVRDVNIGGILNVDGDATFGDDVFVDDNLSVGGELSVSDVATFFSDALFNQNVTVGRQSSLNNVLVGSALTVSSLSPGVDISTNVFVDGDIDLDGSIDVENDLNVSGITTLAELNVTGDVDIQNDLNVSGITTLAELDVTGDIDLDGSIDVETNLNVSGITTVQVLDVDDDSTFINITSINNINSSGIITSAQIDTILVETVALESNFSQLGIATISEAYIGIGTVDNNFFVGRDLEVERNLTVLGTSEFVGSAIFRGGTIGIGDSTADDINVIGEFVSDLVPNDDDAYDLGKEGKQWKDLYLNGLADLDDVKIEESLIDSNDNVGYANTQYKVPRSVLGSVAVDDQGEVITDRFFDAANQIRLNLDFIAEEAVGYIVGPDYKSGPLFTMQDNDYTSCKDDIKDILKAITIDITKGGNEKTVGAGLSYYAGNTLLHITGTDINGYSIKDATIAAIGAASTLARYVINNASPPKLYQPRPTNPLNGDAARLIENNIDFIATEAVDRTIYEFPSLVIPQGNLKCVDDIKKSLQAVIYNLEAGGNDKVFDAGKLYLRNPALLSGEVEESIYAYESARNVANKVIRNSAVSKISGTLNTYTQFFDNTILGDFSGIAGDYQVSPEDRDYDSYNLIIANRREIQDRALAGIAKAFPDFFFPGDDETNGRSRYYDAYRLITLNRQAIIDEAYNDLITLYPNYDGNNGNTFGPKCRRDIGYLVDYVATDVFTGGNIYAQGFAAQYLGGSVSGEEVETIYAFEQARDYMKIAINNSWAGADYQDLTITGDPNPGFNSPPFGTKGNLTNNTSSLSCTDVQDNIDNLVGIITTVINSASGESLDDLSDNFGTFTSGGSKCFRDIGFVVDAIAEDLRDRSNCSVVSIANSYFENGTPVLEGVFGEEEESIEAFHVAGDLIKLALTNGLLEKDLTITADPLTGSNISSESCASQQAFVDNLVGIITTPIGTGDITTIPTIAVDCSDQVCAISQLVGIITSLISGSGEKIERTTGIVTFKQIKDLTIQDDPLVGFNTDPNGCVNVVSAIDTYAGIVTSIIEDGPSVTPDITEPDGKIVWVPPGADSKNVIYVTKYGNDMNGGRTEGDAKLTIAGAAAIAEPGDTIFVRSGTYYEQNPIGLQRDVGVSGQDLRLVTVVPLNIEKDLFHVRRGCLIENMNFQSKPGELHTGAAIVAFPPTQEYIDDGRAFGALTGYTEPGPADEGPTGRWKSPYCRNCTNFVNESIGMKIEGDHATGSTIGANLKSMVVDAYTQYNENGIGISITNSGYAQLVSLFTIACDIGVYVSSGGQCDLTNSNSSFGNYGLYGDGLSRLEFESYLGEASQQEADVFSLYNVADQDNNVRRPYDGQAIWFGVEVDGEPITQPLQLLESVEVIDGGSGYSPAGPPNIIIRDEDGTILPKGPEGIIAEVSPTIDALTGQITEIDIVSSGRNYLATQNIIVDIEGDAVAKAKMAPIYYTILESTEPTPPNHRYADAVQSIQTNLKFIAAEAVDRTLYHWNVTLGIPFEIPTGNSTCVEDLELAFGRAITYNLQFGGNDRTYDAANFYFTNPYLQGEEEQSIYAYHEARDIAKSIINNVAVTKQEYTDLNSYEQIFDYTINVDPISGNNIDPGNCADVQASIDSLVGIVTTAITTFSPSLPASRTTAGSIGISTVVLNEFVPYPVGAGASVYHYRISRIIASGQSFEYIGSGTDINKATPQQGGVPIKENEVIAINGAQVPYTSSDQAGNFNIGGGIQISQTTASISGRDFNRSIQAQVTPLILALS